MYAQRKNSIPIRTVHPGLKILKYEKIRSGKQVTTGSLEP